MTTTDENPWEVGTEDLWATFDQALAEAAQSEPQRGLDVPPLRREGKLVATVDVKNLGVFQGFAFDSEKVYVLTGATGKSRGVHEFLWDDYTSLTKVRSGSQTEPESLSWLDGHLIWGAREGGKNLRRTATANRVPGL